MYSRETSTKMLESTYQILNALSMFTDHAMEEFQGADVEGLLVTDERFGNMLKTVDLTVVMPLFKMMAAAHAYSNLEHAVHVVYGPSCSSLMWSYDITNRKMINIVATDENERELEAEPELNLNDQVDFELMLFSGLAPYWQKGGEVTVI